jgi:MFS family permease
MRSGVFLLYVTVVGAIAGFLYGYDTGIISGALLHIRAEYQLGSRMQEMVASSILVGAVLGALACGRAIERIGRRRTVTLLACGYTVGAIASPACSWAWPWAGRRRPCRSTSPSWRPTTGVGTT